MYTLIGRIISIVTKGTSFNAAASQGISICVVGGNIRATVYTFSTIRISKLRRISAIENTDMIISIVIRE